MPVYVKTAQMLTTVINLFTFKNQSVAIPLLLLRISFLDGAMLFPNAAVETSGNVRMHTDCVSHNFRPM